MATNSQLIKLTSEKKSWKWLSLLPTVSVSSTWDPFTQVYRPTVNFGISLSNLSNYIQTSNRNRIEREKLAISLQEQLSSQLIAIDAEILDLKRDSIALTYEHKNIMLLEELYTIKSKQYEQNQINLEEKIRHQMNLNNSKHSFEIRKLNYENKQKKLINKLKKRL
ncbi:TolC family protein [Riemerella columbina]|uniref:TolC family protein n=1 Tax=Riemerella columbina TaxID=103810 RepID=UPI003CCC192A